ncbi:MAG: hypothetical protein RBR10_09140 [Bacteroidales bacterium]|jgi:hypothetical protein|nr:hypothetical protein [Bacteroidales bacterium]MDY0369994.1 hypothetical protein [Bacteroidales bacterium]
MNSEVFKVIKIVMFYLFIGTSCQKDKIEFADENIEISSLPEIAIYKTKNDYFENIRGQVLKDGRVNAIPSLTLNDPRIKVDKNGNIKVKTRWRLRNGYIVDKESSINHVFTDITYQEYVDWNTSNGVNSWSGSSIAPQIIDTDPFTEYYLYYGIGKRERIFTLGEIYEMIQDGTFKTVFTQLK